MSDQDGFLSEIAAFPPTTRCLAYSDRLDDRGDPRGPHLRDECEWVESHRHSRRRADPELRRSSAKLDPVRVAREPSAAGGVDSIG